MKRFWALVMTFILTVSLFIMPCSAATAAEKYSDVPSTYWANSAIQTAVSEGLLSGKSDGKMHPDESVTRGQFATILVRALGLSTAAKPLSGYSDVTSSTWCYNALAIANSLGIIQGSNGKMSPDARVSRQQAAAMLTRALYINNKGYTGDVSKFTDYSAISSYALESLQTMVARGFMQGTSNKLNPQASVTRAQFASIMTRIATGYVSGTETGKTYNGSIVLSGSTANLKSCTVNGDIIITKGFTPSTVTLKDTKVTGTVYTDESCKGLTLTGSSSVGGVYIDSGTQAMTLASDTSGTVGTVTVADSASKFIMSGKADTLIVNDSNTNITVNQGSINKLTINGSNSSLTTDKTSVTKVISIEGTRCTSQINGTANTINLEQTTSNSTLNVNHNVGTVNADADDCRITVASGVTLDTVNVDGTDLSLSGSGTTRYVTLNNGATGAVISTRNTTVNNKSGRSVTVGGKSISSGNTGYTNSSGSNSSTVDKTVDDSYASFSVPATNISTSALGYDPATIYSALSINGYSISGTLLDLRTNITGRSGFSTSTSHYFVPIAVSVNDTNSNTTIKVQNTLSNTIQTYNYAGSYKTSGTLSGKFLIWAEVDASRVGNSNLAKFTVTVDADGSSTGYTSTTYTLYYNGVTCSVTPPVDTRIASVYTASLPNTVDIGALIAANCIDFTDPSDSTLSWNLINFTSTTVSNVQQLTGEAWAIPAKLSASTRSSDPSGSIVLANTECVVPLIVDVSGFSSTTTLTVSVGTSYTREYTYWDGNVATASGNTAIDGKFVVWIPVTANKDSVTLSVDTDGSANTYKPTTTTYNVSNATRMTGKPLAIAHLKNVSSWTTLGTTEEWLVTKATQMYNAEISRKPADFGAYTVAYDAGKVVVTGQSLAPFGDSGTDVYVPVEVSTDIPYDATTTASYAVTDSSASGNLQIVNASGLCSLVGIIKLADCLTDRTVAFTVTPDGASAITMNVPVDAKAVTRAPTRVQLSPSAYASTTWLVRDTSRTKNYAFNVNSPKLTFDGAQASSYADSAYGAWATFQFVTADLPAGFSAAVLMSKHNALTDVWTETATGATTSSEGANTIVKVNLGTNLEGVDKVLIQIADTTVSSDSVLIPMAIVNSTVTSEYINSAVTASIDSTQLTGTSSFTGSKNIIDVASSIVTDNAVVTVGNKEQLGAGKYATLNISAPTDAIKAKCSFNEDNLQWTEYFTVTDSKVSVDIKLRDTGSNFSMIWLGVDESDLGTSIISIPAGTYSNITCVENVQLTAASMHVRIAQDADKTNFATPWDEATLSFDTTVQNATNVTCTGATADHRALAKLVGTGVTIAKTTYKTNEANWLPLVISNDVLGADFSAQYIVKINGQTPAFSTAMTDGSLFVLMPVDIVTHGVSVVTIMPAASESEYGSFAILLDSAGIN